MPAYPRMPSLGRTAARLLLILAASSAGNAMAQGDAVRPLGSAPIRTTL